MIFEMSLEGLIILAMSFFTIGLIAGVSLSRPTNR